LVKFGSWLATMELASLVVTFRVGHPEKIGNIHMSPKARFPRITALRVAIVLAFAVAVFCVFKFFGGNEWVIGITMGLAVVFGSTVGARWRNTDARKSK
jgi:DMSO reductase anchor subunit